jgi:16S rRNA (cytidine1402-2'-O)-methyltransferase
MTATLYIIATPIGNLDDLTLRALKTLKTVPVIACEDTRHSRKLFNKYKLRNKLISYYQPKEKQKAKQIINLLKKGTDVALISNAGTPCISDPGYPLVRAAINENIKIVPIPGASAVTTALSAAGLPTHKFLFLGFPPVKKQATKKLLQSLSSIDATLVFYLPPRKIISFLDTIQHTLSDRQIVIAREMTKIFEEFIRGSAEELLYKLRSKTIKGEVTVLIQGSSR